METEAQEVKYLSQCVAQLVTMKARDEPDFICLWGQGRGCSSIKLSLSIGLLSLVGGVAL